MLATNPAPVVVHRLPRFWFVLPMTLPTIRFGDIGPNDCLAERLQGVIAVVSLVGDRLDRSLRVHPFAHLFLLVVQATSAMCSPAWGRVSRIVAVSPASPVATVTATTAPVSRVAGFWLVFARAAAAAAPPSFAEKCPAATTMNCSAAGGDYVKRSRGVDVYPSSVSAG